MTRIDLDRRDFLKMVSLGAAAPVVSACLANALSAAQKTARIVSTKAFLSPLNPISPQPLYMS
jgi:hypothetical protein